MYCRYCGKEIPENANFCPNCGQKQNKYMLNRGNSWINRLGKYKTMIFFYVVWCLIHIGLLVFSPSGKTYVNYTRYPRGWETVHQKINDFYPFDTSLTNVFLGKGFWLDPLGNLKVYDYSELFFYVILFPFLICAFAKIGTMLFRFFKHCYHSAKQNLSVRMNTTVKVIIAIVCIIVLGVKKCDNFSDGRKEAGKQSVIITGNTPYLEKYGANIKCNKTQCSGINVTAPETSDVVVIVKKNNEHGKVVGHVYISAGDTYKIDLPDGTYQAFFYYGEEWNPNKDMGNGVKGGFVRNEVFSKADPEKIYSAVISYVLQLRKDGNFQTRTSNSTELF